MASRAGQGAAVGAEGSRADAEPVGPAFPAAIRIVLLSAVLLLALSTVLTVLRMNRPGAAGTAPGAHADAELLAARAEAKVERLRTSVQGVAEIARQTMLTPTDAAEAALRLGRPVASGAAVVEGGQILAEAGVASDADWLAAAASAASFDQTAWVGAPAQERARWTYASGAIGAGRWVVLAADLQPLVDSGPGEARVLASADGALLAAAGVSPDAADLSALGLDRGHAAAEDRVGRDVSGRLGPGRPARFALAPSSDGEVIAAVAGPGGAVAGDARTNTAANLFSLFLPLLIGCALIAMLLLQTRKAEAARRARAESERRFRLAVEAARCGIWEWRLNDQTVFMSDLTGVMLGWGGGGFVTSDEVIAHIAPEHRDRVRAALAEARRFGAFDVSFRVPRPSGGYAWIDARGQAFGQPDGSGYDTLIGVALDVTEERTAEQRAQAAERRLHDAIDSVSEAFVLWDRRGRLLMCNQNFRSFFSIDAQAVRPGASREMVQKVAELVVRRRLPAPDGKRGVREVELIDGRWLQISERRTAEGGLVMTAADITAVKRQEEARRLNEEALQNAVARLEESSRELAELAEKYQAEKIRAESANSAKSEFLANMSHELRTPLNAINGFSEMMATEMFGPLGDPRYKEYMQDILASGQHLLALINDILDMSKIEAGKLSLRLDWIEVRDVVEEAVRLIRNRAEATRLELAADIAADLPEIEADYRAVKQVLLNLLSNAIKFTPAGGRVQVRAATTVEGGVRAVRISVADTGVGIAREDIGRLARPFEQIETQHSKTAQGTGLGLALSKALVELHGGVFVLDSEAGVGTTVSFTLPADREAHPTSPPREEPAERPLHPATASRTAGAAVG